MIVIGSEVEIGAAVVAHNNLVVQTGAATGGDFVPVDPGDTDRPKLQALVLTLNAIHVPKRDIIDIIKGLARDRKLHGQLIIE